MARPRSEDKRLAILESAAEVVGEFGLSAPTVKISQLAGVAEGTLFMYFANKDDLLNQLYLALKTELRDSFVADYPATKSLLDRCRHVWNRYITWGTANPLKRKCVRQLAVSDRITKETKKTVEEAFMEFHAVIHECAAGGLLRDQPPAFASAVMGAIAETTMEFIAREPTHVKRYTKAGFESFWRAVTG